MSPRAVSSSEIESTRNGESSVATSIDGAVASVAVVVEVGVEDADGGGLEASAVGELEGGGRERVQLVGRDRFEVVVGQPAQQRASEDLEGFGPSSRVGRLARDPSEHLLDLGMELGGCPGGAR